MGRLIRLVTMHLRLAMGSHVATVYPMYPTHCHEQNHTGIPYGKGAEWQKIENIYFAHLSEFSSTVRDEENFQTARKPSRSGRFHG